MNRKLIPLMAVAVILATGCQNLFQSIITVTQVRDRAMTELAQLHAKGWIDEATDLKIQNADNAYLAANRTAERALLAYQNGGDRAAYIAALTAVKQAVGEILAILNPLNTDEANNLELQLAKAVKP